MYIYIGEKLWTCLSRCTVYYLSLVLKDFDYVVVYPFVVAAAVLSIAVSRICTATYLGFFGHDLPKASRLESNMRFGHVRTFFVCVAVWSCVIVPSPCLIACSTVASLHRVLRKEDRLRINAACLHLWRPVPKGLLSSRVCHFYSFLNTYCSQYENEIVLGGKWWKYVEVVSRHQHGYIWTSIGFNWKHRLVLLVDKLGGDARSTLCWICVGWGDQEPSSIVLWRSLKLNLLFIYIRTSIYMYSYLSSLIYTYLHFICIYQHSSIMNENHWKELKT